MLDWLEVWTDLGKKHGLKIDALRPIPLVIGGVESYDTKQSIRWIERETLEKGPLGIHKRLLQHKKLPFPYILSAGARHTLGQLANIVREFSDFDDEALSHRILALFSAASLHEYRGSDFGAFVETSMLAEKNIMTWIEKLSQGDCYKHLRAMTLGPEIPFLSTLDFYKVIGDVRPVTSEEFCLAVFTGHKRVLDRFRLVIPHYQKEIPMEIETEITEWLLSQKKILLVEARQKKWLHRSIRSHEAFDEN
ncbi:MAG: hypothetical protein K5905_14080 [Roseibium sp.]|uniref:hypothetical protein n=1 Tax=Roseibium sp. TaxID=1936156 RepID=UPI00260DB01A|nr:hypothetical protein [Roseibium sp.]MCV0426593.1 hypothetical protein [Roseibium sp.]